MAQRRHRAVHETEICHFGYPPEFFGRDLGDRREHCHHRVVDPDLERSERFLDRIGSTKHGVRLRHVCRRATCLGAQQLDFSPNFIERAGVARDQAHPVARAREAQGGGPADPVQDRGRV